MNRLSRLEQSWYAEPPARSPAWPLLRAAALAFEGVARARAAVWDQRYLAPERVGARVLSVGNLNVGGAGKTPVVIALAERLVAAGKRVAVVSRGYGGRGRPAIVSRDGKVLANWREVGDEPVLIARRVPGAGVLVDPDRVRGAKRAVAELGARVILLDDAFQHRRLARDEDVLVLGGSRPFGNGALLPAGPLREPVGAAARATLLWLANGADAPIASKPRVISRYVSTYLVEMNGARVELDELRGKKVVALAGLARPDGFLRALAELGAEVVRTELFRDHHPYTADDLAGLAADALVVTTEKDAVRLEGVATKARILALRIDVQVTEGEALLAELVARC